MAKIVRYNGLKDSYYGCFDARNLVKGQAYEVEYEEIYSDHTYYCLKGVVGYYDSVWFDIEKKVYNAIGTSIPKPAYPYHCTRFIKIDGVDYAQEVITTPVKFVTNLGNNRFHVVTQSSEYYVNVD